MNQPAEDIRLDSQQREALSDVVARLRELIEYSLTLNADADRLAGWAGSLGSLGREWAEHSGRRGLELYNADPDEDLNSILPTSPVTGQFNPLAPPVRMRRKGDEVLGEISFGKAYEGPSGSVHGAVVAAVYDQLLAVANALHGTAGPTARLDVEYLRPTPLETPLTFSCRVENQQGRKVTVVGECHAGDRLVSRCSSLFIQFIA